MEIQAGRRCVLRIETYGVDRALFRVEIGNSVLAENAEALKDRPTPSLRGTALILGRSCQQGSSTVFSRNTLKR